MYGFRDAAHNWEEQYGKVMTKETGFTQGAASPCHFHHKGKNIYTVVHGDDFISAGPDKELKWMKKKLQEAFEIKTSVLGNGEGEVQELTVLNTVTLPQIPDARLSSSALTPLRR